MEEKQFGSLMYMVFKHYTVKVDQPGAMLIHEDHKLNSPLLTE